MPKVQGMDSIKNSGFKPKDIQRLTNIMRDPWKKPNEGFKQMQMKKKSKKMSPDQIAKRKKSMIGNAAKKVMGGNYSK